MNLFLKICPQCKIEKSLANFYKEEYRSFCKRCTKENHKILLQNKKRKKAIGDGFKICKKCNIRKSINEFHKMKNGKFGVRTICKECLRSSEVKEKELRLALVSKGFKICSKCEKDKPLSEFHKHKKAKFGVTSICKICMYQYKKEKRNLIKQEKIKLALKNKILNNLRSRLSHALKRNSKIKHTLEYIGCTLEELKNHLESRFIDGMNWDNYGKWHIDHIRPCARFDLSNPEEQHKCFHFSNLQPLWEKDNLIKGDKF
jgi:hypothetical protein